MIESSLLKQRLQVLRGTLKRAIALNGLGRLVTAIVGCFFVAFLLDYFVFRWDRPENTAFRCLMLLGVIGIAGWIAYFKLIAPLSVPLETDDMALAVEKEFPNLNDSLISTMQLTRMLNTDASVSTPMVEEVSRQAHEATAALDFDQVVKFDRIKPVLIAGVAALVLFAVSQAFLHARIGLYRLVNPLSNTAYPVETQILVKGGPNEIVWPRNEALKIVAEVSGKQPKIAYIKFDHGSGFKGQEPITTSRTIVDEDLKSSKREFEFEYNPVTTDFSYVIVAGDNQSEVHKVRAVDRPRMDNLDVVYEYPNYISDKKTEPRRDTTIMGVTGTKATITVMANKPLKEAQLKLGNDQPITIRDFSGDGKLFNALVELDTSKDYEIFLTDTDGIDNGKNKIRHKIVVKPDSVPHITWRRPGTDLEVSPAAIVGLGLVVDDDFGLQKSVIKYKKYKMITPPAPAGGQNAPHPVVDASAPAVEGTFDLVGDMQAIQAKIKDAEDELKAADGDKAKVSQAQAKIQGLNEALKAIKKQDFSQDWALSELNLQPSDMIEYWAEAYDWCPTKGRKQSEPQIFRLKVLSPNQIMQLLDIQRQRLVEDLIAIIRLEETDKKQVGQVAEHLKFGNPFDTSQRSRVSEAGSMQEEARRKTQALQKGFENLIARYKSNGIDTPDEIDRLREVGEQLGIEHTEKMPDASKTIVNSAMLKDDTQRIEQLRKAESKQGEIIEDLNQLLAKMQKWAETEELLRLTRDLLAKQKVETAETIPFKDRLGAKQPADATKDELNDVKGLEHKQRDCANDMKTLFQRMAQALAKMQGLDKFVAKNIEDSIRVAQNTDATVDKPDLTTAGDPIPSIEDKMNGAQTDISKFNFGTANGKQRAAENALSTIIVYLSRRPGIDRQLPKDIEAAIKQAERNLEVHREIEKLTKAIKDKQELQQGIANATKQVKDLQQREAEIRKQTESLNNEANAEASRLEAALAEAKKDLDGLIKEEGGLRTETEDAMTQPEIDLARALSNLEEIEITERALSKEMDALAKASGDKPAGVELKKAEVAMTANADKQADTRNALDEITARMAAMIRAANVDKPDAKLGVAGAAAAKALPDLESSSHDMGEAADVLRRGSSTASKDSLTKGASFQLSAADKIAKARAALKGASAELGKDKKSEYDNTGKKQEQTQGKAAALREKLTKLGADVDKAHAAASGSLEKPAADPASAATKLGEASDEMGKAKDELKKPDPSSASKAESKAIDAMLEAQKKLDEMERKIGEVKDPARRLVRVQNDVKNETRKIAEEIKGMEQQLPSGPTDPKADEKLKNAANNMQNAQNSLGNATKSDGKSGGKPGESGKSSDKPGEPGKSGEKPGESGKNGDKPEGEKKPEGKQDNPDNPKKPGDDGEKPKDKGGDPTGQNKDEAKKQEEKALTELEKALQALEALAKKAESESADHKDKALAKLQKEQIAAREGVQTLQPKLDQMEKKTGNEKAKSASKANENAAKNQSEASGKMGQGKQSEAQKSQVEAEEDLQQVLDDLKQFQDQVKDQQNKEKLFQIEQELKKILAVQNDLTKRTGDTDKLNPGRPKKLTLIQVFKDQLTLADSTKVVVKMLGEAPVFEFVLQTAVEDMNEAASRLDKDNSGTGTQGIQDDAAKKISDLIEALKKERQKPQPPKQGGGGGGGKQPLVPSLAQMKMLLIMQKDVDRRIIKLNGEVTKSNSPELTKDQKDLLRRAAEVQGKIQRITLKTAEEIEGKDVPQKDKEKTEDDAGK